jgi:hypothetical protein
MALIDPGRAILEASGHAIIAALSHRNNDGNLAMLSPFLAWPSRKMPGKSCPAATSIIS